jgi:hypothetical protein
MHVQRVYVRFPRGLECYEKDHLDRSFAMATLMDIQIYGRWKKYTVLGLIEGGKRLATPVTPTQPSPGQGDYRPVA